MNYIQIIKLKIINEKTKNENKRNKIPNCPNTRGNANTIKTKTKKISEMKYKQYKGNLINKINKWNLQQYKSVGKKWKSYTLKKNDPKGFHFAKNSRFLNLPKNNSYEGYSDRDNIDIMIDYKNNVHFVLQEKQLKLLIINYFIFLSFNP